MDARVNDFLNEINEIAPLSEKQDETPWEKCLDEDSGYYYYWNTRTNEVTWDMPADYKVSSKTKTKKSGNLYMPPRTAPLFPSTSNLLPPVSDAIKIYKIGECSDSASGGPQKSLGVAKNSKSESAKVSCVKEDKKKPVKKPYPGKLSDSDDEKIVLISSYGGDSESEEEAPKSSNKIVNGSSHASAENMSNASPKSQKKPPVLPETSKKSSAFSLVAGYSDSEEESEAEEIKTAPPEAKIAHSTLFPITKPIDIKDFQSNPQKSDLLIDSDFDSKAFQRKRRIGVALVNTGKKDLKVADDGGLERKGLGFGGGDSSSDQTAGAGASSSYAGFKSGGVMFVKADVLNPVSTQNDVISNSDRVFEEKIERISKETEDGYTTLKEKLGFLSEGREEVSPVQVMLIQLETLFTALKAGDLKQRYLRKWLDETCADLVKLEKEATPEGWLLQWDRSHKRYYYQNEASGESQWEYPQADVTVCDEAMDICTTPPPSGAEPTIHMSPPLPPIIASPSPPPPPIITDCAKPKKKKCDIPLPPLPPETQKQAENGEPLPPGVDLPEAPPKNDGDLSDALSSFYSDIAAIETSNSPPVSLGVDDVASRPLEDVVDNSAEPAKKKKKTKVKLAQGIAMKKKGVSKLVEKWKNVQMSYND